MDKSRQQFSRTAGPLRQKNIVQYVRSTAGVKRGELIVVIVGNGFFQYQPGTLY